MIFYQVFNISIPSTDNRSSTDNPYYDNHTVWSTNVRNKLKMGLNFSGIGLPPISHFSNLNIRLLHGFVEYDTLREKKNSSEASIML